MEKVKGQMRLSPAVSQVEISVLKPQLVSHLPACSPPGISKCSNSLLLKVQLLVPASAVYSSDKLFVRARVLFISFQLSGCLYSIKIDQTENFR